MISYRNAFLIALFIHLILLSGFNIKLSTPKKNVSVTQKIEHIKAITVSQASVDKEVKRLKEEKLIKIKKEDERQAKLRKEQLLIKKRISIEKNRLADLKKEAAREKKRIIKNKKLAAKKLAKLKLAQTEEAKKLKKIKDDAIKQKLLRKKKLEELAKKEKAEKLAKEQQERKRLAAIKQKELDKAMVIEKARIAGVVDRYKSLITQAISQRWILPSKADKNMSCKFQIKVAPGGDVLAVRLLSSSGSSALDRSAKLAIYKASPLPVPSSQSDYEIFKVFNLTVRPESVLSEF